MNSRTHVTIARGPVAYIVLGVIVLGVAAAWELLAPFVLSAVVAGGAGTGVPDLTTLVLVVRAVVLLVVVGGVASIVRGIVGLVRRESPAGSSARFYVDLGVEPWLLDELRGSGSRPGGDAGAAASGGAAETSASVGADVSASTSADDSGDAARAATSASLDGAPSAPSTPSCVPRAPGAGVPRGPDIAPPLF